MIKTKILLLIASICAVGTMSSRPSEKIAAKILSGLFTGTCWTAALGYPYYQQKNNVFWNPVYPFSKSIHVKDQTLVHYAAAPIFVHIAMLRMLPETVRANKLAKLAVAGASAFMSNSFLTGYFSKKK